MGDAAEGLIDADARLQERMEELEESRKAARDRRPRVDPEVARETESLRLARTELQRQFEAATHPARKAQLKAALAEVDRRRLTVAPAPVRKQPKANTKMTATKTTNPTPKSKTTKPTPKAKTTKPTPKAKTTKPTPKPKTTKPTPTITKPKTTAKQKKKK